MAKLKMSQLSRMKVYVPGKPSKRANASEEDNIKKLGRLHNLVFSSDSSHVVGFMIKRPDIAGMVKQEDRFVALDCIDVREGGIVCSDDKAAFDAPACKRLGINLDTCIIWGGADVKTQSGAPLGYVVDACFDSETGVVDYYSAQEGSTASALVGNFDIPAAWVIRFDAGCMIVRNEAANLELSGGLAGKAGEGYAAAKDKAKEAGAKAGAAASVAVDKGSHALGGVIGKAKVGIQKAAQGFQEGQEETSQQSGSTTNGQPVASGGDNADNVQKAARAVGGQVKKTKTMFSDFMREFKDASK